MSGAQLTTLSAIELASMIRGGQTTAVEVLHAHTAVLDRIEDLNAVAARRQEAALVEAEQVDARIAAGEDDLPPLLGVPVTIKEMLAVTGLPHTGGHVHRRHYLQTQDATVVQRVRQAGVIVLASGNTSGAIPWVESNHPLYGRTGNAYDAERTAGGSSGGDGAMVGSGAAPFALASDLGGSVRVPAYFNGIFGHLPTRGLVPLTGHFPMPEGPFRRLLSPGVLARRAQDLEPVLRLIAGPDGSDPHTSLDDALGDPASVEVSGMRVVVPTASALRAVAGESSDAVGPAARALADRGAVVVEDPLREMRGALSQFAATALAEFDLLASWLGLTETTRPGTRQLLRLLLHGPTAVLSLAELAPTRRLRALGARRLVSAAEHARQALTDTIGGGVLLYPPFPLVAPRHRGTLAQPWLLTNNIVFNLYGMPVTQVPTGLGHDGLPRGLQVVGAPGDDHVTIATALRLEEAFGGWVAPS